MAPKMQMKRIKYASLKSAAKTGANWVAIKGVETDQRLFNQWEHFEKTQEPLQEEIWITSAPMVAYKWKVVKQVDGILVLRRSLPLGIPSTLLPGKTDRTECILAKPLKPPLIVLRFGEGFQTVELMKLGGEVVASVPLVTTMRVRDFIDGPAEKALKRKTNFTEDPPQS